MKAGGDRAAEAADCLLARGDWEKAAEIYRRLREAEPASERAALGLGIIAFHQGRRNEAAGFLDMLGPRYRNHPQAEPMRALIELGRADRVELQRRLKSASSSGEAACLRGILAAARGEYGPSLEYLLQALAEGNREAERVFKLVLTALGTDSEGASEYRKRREALSG